MKILLLFTFMAAANAAAIGSERCTWGPAYWCDHPLKAKECGEGATQYCLENDWAELVVKDESLCEDCKGLISDFKSALNNGEVQDDIIRVLKDLCDKMGSKATTCKLIVDLYGKDFLEKLVTELDPSKVCTLLDLCKEANPTKNMAAIILLPEFQADPCADCKQIFTDLKDILSNKTVQQFIFNELITVCHQDLGLPVSECKMIIDQYFPMVFQNLIQYLDGDEICKALGICTGFNKFDFLRKVGSVKVDPCTDCKEIFADLKDILSNTTIQQFLAKEIEQECTDAGLPALICDEVGSYVPMVLNYIADMLDGDVICQALGICTSGKPFDVRQFVLKGIQSQVNKVSGDLCSDCKQAIGDVRDMLSNKTLQDAIFKLAIEVCEAAGLSESTCKSYVDQYGQEIFNELLQYLDANAICQSLGVCKGSLLNLPVFVQNELPQVTGDMCKECKEIVTDLKDILNNANVQKNILDTLEKVCDALGVSPASCKSAISQYGTLILDAIVQGLDANTICSQPDLCTASIFNRGSQVMSTFKQLALSTGDLCTECKQMFADLKDVISNTSIQQDIFKELIAVCEALGVSSSSCTSNINNYGPLVISLIEGYLDPATCTTLGLCTSITNIQPEVLPEAAQDVEVTGDICKKCKEALDDLDDILENITIENNIIKTMVKVCLALGVPAETCQSTVGQYGGLIIYAIIEAVNAKTICSQPYLCTARIFNKGSQVMSTLKQLALSTGDPCTECKQMFADLKDVISNTTIQQDIFKELIAACEAFGVSSSSCTSNINNYGPLVISLIEGYLDPATCTSLGLCTSITNIQPEVLPEAAQDVEVTGDICKECKEALDDLDDILMNTTIQNNIIKTLEKVCVALGVSAGSCKSAIGQYGPIVLNAIAQGLNGETLCPEQHFCGAPAVKLHHAVSLLKQIVKATGDPCAECKQMFADITDILNNQKAQQTIFKEFIAVCEALGVSSSSCTSNIDNYGPLIIGFITGLLTPSTCSSLQFCPAMTTYIQPETPSYLGDDVKVTGDICKECKEALDDLDDILMNTTIQNNIIKTLEKVCVALGVSAGSCQSAIGQYGPIVLNAIAQGLNGETLCPEQHFCGASAVKLHHAVSLLKQIVKATGDPCAECKQMFADITDILNNQKAQQTIFKEFIAVCEALGVSSSSCTSNIDNYGPLIIGFITGLLTPSTCSSLQFCPAMTTYIQPETPSYLGDDVEVTGDICKECKEALDDLDDILMNTTIQNNIIKTLEKVCVALGVSAGSCQSAIGQYGPIVLNAIAQGLNGETLCPEQHFCGASAVKLHHAVSLLKQIVKATGDPCAECKQMFADITDILNNQKAQQTIFKEFIAVCEALGVSSSSCTSNIDNYGPLIIGFITGLLTPSTCSSLQFCPAMTTYIQPETPSYLGDDVEVTGDICKECKEALDDLDDILMNTTIQNNIIKTLEKVCVALGVPAGMCQSLIGQYGPIVLNAIAQGLNGETLCPEQHFCGASAVKLHHAASLLKQIVKATGDPCAECKQMFADITDILNNQKAQQTIFKEFIAVCEALGVSSSSCTSNIDNYGPLIIGFITGELTPSTCSSLMLCPAMTTNIQPEMQSYLVNVPNAAGDLCKECKEAITDLKDILSNSTEQKNILNTIEKVCEALGVAPDSCQGAISQYGQLVLDAVVSELDPNTICKGTCSASNHLKQVVTILKQLANAKGDMCVECKQMMTDFADILGTQSVQQDIFKELIAVCEALGMSSSSCTSDIDNYGPLIIGLITGYLTPSTCSSLQLCPQMMTYIKPEPASLAIKASGENSCTDCKQIVADLLDILTNGTIQNRIFNEIIAICTDLGIGVNECSDTIAHYGPIVMNAMTDKLTPSLCNDVKLCSPRVPTEILAAHLRPAIPVLDVGIESGVGDIQTCVICQVLMDALQSIYPKGASATQLKTTMETICSYIPDGSSKKLCTDFVSQHGDAAIQALVTLKFDYPKVCAYIKVCPGQDVGVESGVGDNQTCVICQVLMDALQSIYPKGASATQLKTTMETICSYIPDANVKKLCTDFVSQYGDAAIKALITLKFDYPKVCAYIKVCPGQDVGVESGVGDNQTCVICQVLMDALQSIYPKGASATQLKKTMETICSYIPDANVKKLCTDFVSQYGDAAIKALITLKFDYPKVCAYIKVCPGQDVGVESGVGDIQTCVMCQILMDALQSIYPNGTSTTQLKKTMETICSYIPDASGKKLCTDFVSKYGDTAIQALMTLEFDYPRVCAYIKVCPEQELNQEKVPDNLDDIFECVQCYFVKGYLVEVIKPGVTKAQVNAAMDAVCILIAYNEVECGIFIGKYRANITQYILSGKPLAKLCEALGVCDDPELNQEKVPDNLDDIFECVQCYFVKGYLVEVIKPGVTKAQVNAAMDAVCILIAYNEVECGIFIGKYRANITQYILSGKPLAKLCEALGVCDDPADEPVPMPAGNQVDVSTGISAECILCEFIMKEVVGILKKNGTEKDIIDALEKVCSILPSELKKECDDFISKNIDLMVMLILALGPDGVCQGLGVCQGDAALPVAVSAPQQVTIGSSTKCEICEYIVQELDVLLKKNATKEDIENFFDNICKLLPDEEKCKKFVAQYTEEILDLIEAIPPEEICQMLKVCPTSSKAEVQAPQKVKTGSFIECEICKFILQELDAFLKRNSTKEDIENFFDKICKLFTSEYEQTCDAFVAAYTEAILNFIGVAPPEEICQILKVCATSSKSFVQRSKTQVGTSVECELCQYLMDLLERFVLTNATENEVKHFLDNVCLILPKKYTKECENFINTYIDEIMELLKTMGPLEICDALGVCSASKGVAQPKESPTCFLCEMVMKEVDKLLNEPKSKEEIEKVLEMVCSLMPDTIRQECQDFVKDYAPEIIQLLLQFVTPQRVCDELKLCKPAAAVAPKLPIPHILGGPACGPCEMVIGQVQIILKETATEKEIEDFLKTKVCSLMKGESKTACITFVDKYLPEIIQVITSMTPEEVCGLLGLCGSDKTMEKMVSSAINSTAECMICELIVKEIRTGLAQNATQAEIQKFLDMVCSKVPLSSFSKACQGFVNDYTKPIIKYLLAEMDPDTICDLLKVCTPSINKHFAVSKVNDNTLCLICDVLVDMLEKQLENNNSLDEVTKLIENICTLFPSPLNDQCRAFLDIYGPVLLKLLVNSELSPNDVCKDLRLCTSATVQDPRLKSSDDCTECKLAVSMADDYIKAHKDQILDEIAKLCDLLPQADQKECKNVVEVYGAYVFDLILSEYLSPDALCKDLGLCNSTALGRPSNKCSIGPMFWCSSMDNAKLCNAVEHCRRHAWN